MKSKSFLKMDINLRPVEQLERRKKRLRSTALWLTAIALLGGAVYAAVHFPSRSLQLQKDALAQQQALLSERSAHAERFDSLKAENMLMQGRIQTITQLFAVQGDALGTIRMVQQCTPDSIAYQAMELASASIRLAGTAPDEAALHTLAEGLGATGVFGQVSILNVTQQPQTQLLSFEMMLIYPMEAAQSEAAQEVAP